MTIEEWNKEIENNGKLIEESINNLNQERFFKSVNEINEACFVEFQEKYIKKQNDQIEAIKNELDWLSRIAIEGIPFEHKKNAIQHCKKHLKSLIK